MRQVLTEAILFSLAVSVAGAVVLLQGASDTPACALPRVSLDVQQAEADKVVYPTTSVLTNRAVTGSPVGGALVGFLSRCDLQSKTLFSLCVGVISIAFLQRRPCLLWGEGDRLVLSEGEGDAPLEGSGQAVILSLLCYCLPLLHLYTDASAGPQCVIFSADKVSQQTRLFSRQYINLYHKSVLIF